MFAIYKRELKSYFTSVIACLFVAVTTFISGLFFVNYNLTYGTPEMYYPVSQCLLILVFTAPILTMKVMADEKRQKTDQLILTAPISIGKIVIGKFLALVTIFIIPILIMCFYPLILSSFGEIAFKTAYTNILGLFLYGVVFIAIGMFISSLTESQVISAILSIVILLLGYLMSTICDKISTEGNIITKILNCFDLLSPMQNFVSGILTLSNVIYYLSLTVLFIFLTCQSIQKRRWNMTKKKIATGVFSSGFIAVAVAVTVFVNMIASFATTNYSWATADMTQQKLYTITDDTVDMLQKLDADIHIYVMQAENQSDTNINKTLERYQTASKHIKIEYKDTTRYPNFYSKYADTAPTANSLIVENKKTGKSKVIDYNEIYVTDQYSYYYTGQQPETEYDCEGQLDSAIAYVQKENTGKVYQVEGHDEAVLDSQNFGTSDKLKEIIDKNNCEIESVNLLSKKEITPQECELLLLLGPEKDYTKEEAQVVINYLNKGGSAIIGLEGPMSDSVDKPNFYSVLEAFHVKVTTGLVAEKKESLYISTYGPYFALAKGEEGYASDLSNYVFSPFSLGLNIIDKNSEDVSYTALASTSKDSFIKKKYENSQNLYEKEKGDEDGPFDTVVSVSKTLDDEKTANLLIFGSVYSLSDSYDDMVSGANTQIVSNALKDYLTTEESDVETVVVPAKSMSTEMLTITESGTKAFGIVVAVVVPIIILLAGIIVWIRRRKR